VLSNGGGLATALKQGEFSGILLGTLSAKAAKIKAQGHPTIRTARQDGYLLGCHFCQ